MRKILVLGLLLLCITIQASEKDYQLFAGDYLGGEVEVSMEGVRVDIITDHNAIEVDYTYKWYEALTQSLYYAILTGKKPGIVLILDGRSPDTMYKHVLRLLLTIRLYDLSVDLWTITTDNIIEPVYWINSMLDDLNYAPELENRMRTLIEYKDDMQRRLFEVYNEAVKMNLN